MQPPSQERKSNCVSRSLLFRRNGHDLTFIVVFFNLLCSSTRLLCKHSLSAHLAEWHLGRQTFKIFEVIWSAFKWLKCKSCRIKEKVATILKQTYNLTERSSQDIVLWFVVISCVEEYLSAYLICKDGLLHAWNHSELQRALIQIFYELRSVEWFCSWFLNCFALLPGYFWYEFWCVILRRSLSFTYVEINLHLKTTYV